MSQLGRNNQERFFYTYTVHVVS